MSSLDFFRGILQSGWPHCGMEDFLDSVAISIRKKYLVQHLKEIAGKFNSYLKFFRYTVCYSLALC